MKINGDNEIFKTGYADKTQNNIQTPTADFKDILKESVENATKIPTEIQSPALMDPLASIRFNPITTADKNAAIDRLDNLLNLLDNYRQQLADPRVTLRAIEPLMTEIAKEKDQISVMLESLPGEDGLKDIANQTLITAFLEIVKFNRGDYIPS